MNSAILFLQVVLVTLIQVQCSEKCTEKFTIVPGSPGRDGRDGELVTKVIEGTLVHLALKVIQEVLHLVKKF